MTDEALGSNPDAAECPRCLKAPPLCVCDGIVPFENRVALLILQHPQEQDKALGTARLTAQHFQDATFKIGLSWSSLAKALGRPADAARWATLYLGPLHAETTHDRDLTVLDGKGRPVPNPEAALAGIEGVVLLDGTWSQAKTLWWRNPWLLKGKRLVLSPRSRSLYGRLRREPRPDGLSTLEAAATAMSRLEGRPEIETTLLASFTRLLDNYRAIAPAPQASVKVRPRRPARSARRARTPAAAVPGRPPKN